MDWIQISRANKAAAKIADRHYSRQKPGTDQFTPPGRVLILATSNYDAIWATSWPFEQYVNRVYPDAWINTIFRNESNRLASELILQAISATRWYYGQPPESGMISLIDPKQVKPIKRRGKLHWGYVYEKAGFEYVGRTQKHNFMIFQLLPERMPIPIMPGNAQKLLPGFNSSGYKPIFE